MWYKKQISSDLSKIELQKLKANVGHSYSDMNLVGQYENAVDILINHIVEKGDTVDAIAHPLLYLMRHSIELALKENIKYLNKYSRLTLGKLHSHSIDFLFKEFEIHYDKIALDLNFKTELENEYDKYAIDLRKIILNLGNDKSSFRYIYSTSGLRVFDDTKILNIYDLKKQFDISMAFLTHTVDVISPYTDFSDYILLDPTIKSKSLGFILIRLASNQKELIIDKLNSKYKTLKENEIWIDEKNNYNLQLKIVNKECFVIPMVN